jgi:hypothetical protein
LRKLARSEYVRIMYTHVVMAQAHRFFGTLCIFMTCMGVFAAGCSHRPAEGEAITDVCVVAKQKSTVSVSGYIKPMGGTTPCDGDGCPFFLTQTAAQTPKGELMVRVSFRPGIGPRQVEVLKQVNYGNKDIVFRDDAGTKFGFGDVVRITGVVDVRPLGDDGRVTCTIFGPSGVQAL